MVVNGPVLASELRRRRVRPRSMVDDVATVERSTWIAGELRAAPTSLLVLAALSLTSDGRAARSRSTSPAPTRA